MTMTMTNAANTVARRMIGKATIKAIAQAFPEVPAEIHAKAQENVNAVAHSMTLKGGPL